MQLHPMQQPTLLFSNGQTGAAYHPGMTPQPQPRPEQGLPLGMHGITMNSMSGSTVPRTAGSGYGDAQNAAMLGSNALTYLTHRHAPNGAQASPHHPSMGHPPMGDQAAPSWMVPQMTHQMPQQMTQQMAAQMVANLQQQQATAMYYNGYPMHPGGQMLGTLQLASHGLDPVVAANAATLHGDDKISTAPLPKLGRLHAVPLKEWTVGITKACKTVFSRLEITGPPKVRDSILQRLLAGVDVDTVGPHTEACPTPCFLVKRGNPGRGVKKSPFQIQVAGSRILAQKALYAAYNKLSAQQMGTWQVNHKCCRSDNDWWCFEPSHLEKCERDHLGSCVEKHPIPRDPDAIYVSRGRSHGPKKEAGAAQPTPVPQPRAQAVPVGAGTYLADGPGGPMGTIATTISEALSDINPLLHGAHHGLASGRPQVSGLHPAGPGPQHLPYDDSASSPSVVSSGIDTDSELNGIDEIEGALTGVADFMPLEMLSHGFALPGDPKLLHH
jgi:hypothetical protein